MLPQNRCGCQRTDLAVEARLYCPSLASLRHNHDDLFRAHDLTDRDGDGPGGNIRQSCEPPFVHLLLPAGFIEVNDGIRFFRLEIRWRIVERQVTVLSDPPKSNIHWPCGQFAADLFCHRLRISLAIQKMMLRDSRLMNEPLEKVLAKTGRMSDWQANVFVQVKQLDAAPINIRGARQGLQEFKLRRTGRGHDPCQTVVADSSAKRFRGMLSRSPAQRMFVLKNLDLQFRHPVLLAARLLAGLHLHTPAQVACCINRFYKHYTATPLSPGTSRCCVRFDGMNKVRKHSLMSSYIADRWRCRAGVPIISRASEIFRRLAQIGGKQTVMLDDHGALGTGQLHSPRISRKHRSSCLKTSYRAAPEFQGSNQRVLRFNLVKRSLTHRLYRRYIPAEPKQEVDGVNGLIDESPTAIPAKAASPARIRVVAGGPEPFHS